MPGVWLRSSGGAGWVRRWSSIFADEENADLTGPGTVTLGGVSFTLVHDATASVFALTDNGLEITSTGNAWEAVRADLDQLLAGLNRQTTFAVQLYGVGDPVSANQNWGMRYRNAANARFSECSTYYNVGRKIRGRRQTIIGVTTDIAAGSEQFLVEMVVEGGQAVHVRGGTVAWSGSFEVPDVDGAQHHYTLEDLSPAATTQYNADTDQIVLLSNAGAASPSFSVILKAAAVWELVRSE